jgi:hypothetical protein
MKVTQTAIAYQAAMCGAGWRVGGRVSLRPGGWRPSRRGAQRNRGRTPCKAVRPMTRPPSPLPVVRSKHEEQLRPDRVCPGPGYSVHSVIEASNLLPTPRLRLLNCDRFFFVFCSTDDLTINFRGDGRQRTGTSRFCRLWHRHGRGT